jgi:hypothetical protein
VERLLKLSAALQRLAWRLAWRGGTSVSAAVCIEDMTAQVVGWLPHLPADIHLDLLGAALGAMLWGGLSEFKASAIVPVRQAMEYGWQWRGEVEEQRRKVEAEADVLRLPVALRAASGGYPIVTPRVPRGRSGGNHRGRPTPNRRT